MEKRPFGRLGDVSAITLGGAGLMGGWGHPADLDEAVATIRSAVDAGIDHIDVAPGYGDGGAERAFGAAFEGSPPRGLRVSTKVPLDQSASGAVAEHVAASLASSLERLRMERVDLLLTHCALLPDVADTDASPRAEHIRSTAGVPLEMFEAEVLPALQYLVSDGRIGDWGVSGIAAPEAVITLLDSDPQPAAVQAITNLLDSAGELHAFAGPPASRVASCAVTAGVPVIGIRAVGRAALTDTLDKAVAPDHPIALDYNRASGLRRLAATWTTPTAELAYRYALSIPGVATVAVGVRNRVELTDALTAERKGPLEPAEQAELRRVARQ